MSLKSLFKSSDDLLPARVSGLVESYLDIGLLARKASWCLVPLDEVPSRLKAIVVEVLSRKVEDGALPQECLDGGLIVGEGPDVLLTYMAWELAEVHVTPFLGDLRCDKEADVI